MISIIGANATVLSQSTDVGMIPLPIPPVDGDDDAQTIYRLENECYKLRVSMSKVRKATQEWFFLETRLKNAIDELDAVKEDRDLMLGGGDLNLGAELDAMNNSSNSMNSSAAAAGPLAVPHLSPVKTEDQKLREKMEQDLHRIEGQLNDHPKFSPEWFKLKEELVELRIKLDEGDAAQKSNKEYFNENNNDIWDEVQVELPPQFQFRPISPPASTSSPSTSASSLSRIVQPAPGWPISNSAPGNNYYNFNNTDDQDTIEQRTLLRSQHAVAVEELDKFPQFSKEWFAAKTKAILLEDQLEELENRSHSGCGGSNRSFSGWSENEEEVEAISCADELECVMVAEALKQGYCVSPTFDEADNDDLLGEDDGNGELSYEDDDQLLQGGDNKGIGIVLFPEDQQEEEDQPLSRLLPICSTSLIDENVDVQRDVVGVVIENNHQFQNDKDNADIAAVTQTEDPPEEGTPSRQEEDVLSLKKEVHKPTSTVNAVLDECANILGNVDIDQHGINNYHAMIVQEKWCNYCNCRPFKRMKSRALAYHAASQRTSRNDNGKKFTLFRFIQNISAKDKYSRWKIFAAVLIQNRWRSYQQRKKFRMTKSLVTKVQALVRCKQQRLQFCEQREKAIAIQCMARKHSACVLRRLLGNHEIMPIIYESESVLEGLKYLQARAVLEQSNHMLAQLKMLKSAVTVQRRWKVYREQLRYNKIRASIFIIQGVVRGWLKQMTPSPQISELYEKHDALSEQLDNLTKYSRDWCDVSEQMRALREQIGRAEQIESRHDHSSMRERSDDVPCIDTESVNFARVRASLEKMSTVSTPKLPNSRWNETFNKETGTSPPPVAKNVPSPESGLVSVTKYRESFEGSPSIVEKSLSMESNKSRSRRGKGPKKPPTLKDLGSECLRLSKRLNQLPKFSPEWTLSKVELKLVTEEMEYLYVESLKKGKN